MSFPHIDEFATHIWIFHIQFFYRTLTKVSVLAHSVRHSAIMQSHNAKHDSWRDMKLSIAKVPTLILVDVHIFYGDPYTPGIQSILGWIHIVLLGMIIGLRKEYNIYTERISFRPGEGTVGDLREFLDKIALRNAQQHMKVAVSRQWKGGIINTMLYGLCLLVAGVLA